MSKGVLVAHNKLEANLQDQRGQGGHGAIPLSAGMLLVTLGVVYGDIGTSPMYTMKSIVANNGGIGTVSEDMILGALSLVIWTMTLVTTVKYVVIAMKADNHNEGGIFALFSLVRKVAPWLILPAMIGGAALLADGILTPAVTVTTAIEGLRTIEWGHALLGDGQTNVIIITIIIICGLFAMQRAGTSSIGKLFGPLMTLWFLFLAGAGLFNMLGNLSILRALNPIRGIMFLFSPINHSGIMVLALSSCRRPAPRRSTRTWATWARQTSMHPGRLLRRPSSSTIWVRELGCLPITPTPRCSRWISSTRSI